VDAGALLHHHPLWVAAMVAVPIVIAAWAVCGSLLLEARHRDELGER
jgi:hypothetical protein